VPIANRELSQLASLVTINDTDLTISFASTVTGLVLNQLEVLGITTLRNISAGVVTASEFVGNGSGLTGIATDFLVASDTNPNLGGNLNLAGFDIVGSGSIILSSGTIQAGLFSGSGANLTNLNADNLSSGTIPGGRFPGTLPILNGSKLTNLNGTQVTNLDASELASGTIPSARFPVTLPTINGENLTDLDASNLGAGTIPNARFPEILPAISAENLTSIPAGNLTGIVTDALLSTVSSSKLSGALPALDGSALTGLTGASEGSYGASNATPVITVDSTGKITGISTVATDGGGGDGDGGGDSLQSRSTAAQTTASIADNATDNITITGFKTYALMKVQLSAAAWIRLYTDGASRTSDASRSVGEDPTPGSGVIAEVVTTGSETKTISPFVIGGNLESTVTTTIYAAVTNLSGSTQTITATLTLLQLEA
jgi:hypothetical protein